MNRVLNLIQQAQCIYHTGGGKVLAREAFGRFRRIIGRSKYKATRKIFRQAYGVRNRLTGERPMCVAVDGIDFQLLPRGGVAFDLWGGFRFEHREIRFILEALRPGMIFFDIGANVGVFTLAAARKLQRIGGQVYAFEPCSMTFQILHDNIRLNQLDNVFAFQMALGDHVGTAILHVNDDLRDVLNTLGRPTHPDSQVVAQEEVPMTIIDDFMATHHVSTVDVMKVDVEGAELLVFKGAENLLRRSDAPLILYEGYSRCTAGFDYHPVEIMWYLQDLGYCLFVLDPKTGQIRSKETHRGYDAMMVAAKPSHPSFEIVSSGASL